MHIQHPQPEPKPQLCYPPDWHLPRNDDCPHNSDPIQPCICQRKRVRKPWRTIRVTSTGTSRVGLVKIPERLVLRIWPNGVITVRGHRRKQEFQTTVAVLYARAAMQAAAEQIRVSKTRKGSKKTQRRAARL